MVAIRLIPQDDMLFDLAMRVLKFKKFKNIQPDFMKKDENRILFATTDVALLAIDELNKYGINSQLEEHIPEFDQTIG